jgi:hypothetical protein
MRFLIVAITRTDGEFEEQHFEREREEVVLTMKVIMSWERLYSVNVIPIPEVEAPARW